MLELLMSLKIFLNKSEKYGNNNFRNAFDFVLFTSHN